MNPYDWQGHQPQTKIERPGQHEIANALCVGRSGVLLAGRGMGKSVFLRQIHNELGRRREVRCFLFPAPPARLTVESCLESLRRQLGVEIQSPLDTQELLQAFLAKNGPGPVVLLYDEFDRYARAPGGAEVRNPGRDFFNNLESTRREIPEVGILAAGSIGVFVFRDVLGSSFLARAERVRIYPFDRNQVTVLAQPFLDRRSPLSENALTALLLASGGHPALTTYGLGALWHLEKPSERDIAWVFGEFHRKHREFLHDFQQSFAAPELSDAPQRVWEKLEQSGGPLSHQTLRQACAWREGILKLDFADVLDLLQAAGLARVRGALSIDPVDVQPIASLLSLPSSSPPVSGLRQRLDRDMERLLARLHAAAPDFFRPGKARKLLVPESVFSSFLALGFGLLGWNVEREAQQAAGRTDIKLSWPATGERAVVEVKIWGRNDFREVHRQVESYWIKRVVAGAVVMLTDRELPDWPNQYARECLGHERLDVRHRDLPDSPIREVFSCTSKTPDAMTARVEHYLLRLPRG